MTDDRDEREAKDGGGESDTRDSREMDDDRTADRPSRFGEFRDRLGDSPEAAGADTRDQTEDGSAEDPETDASPSAAESRPNDEIDSWEWVGGSGDDSGTDGEETPDSTGRADAGRSTENRGRGGAAERRESDDGSADDPDESDTAAETRVWDLDETASDEDAATAGRETEPDETARPDPDSESGTWGVTPEGPEEGAAPGRNRPVGTSEQRHSGESGADATPVTGESSEHEASTDRSATASAERPDDLADTAEHVDRETPDEEADTAGSDGVGRRRRLWNRDETETVAAQEGTGTEVASDESGSTEPLLRGGTASVSGGDLAAGPEEGYRRPDGLGLEPGTSTLVECGSQDDRKHAACRDLIGLEGDGDGRDVLFVRYRRMDPGRLERIATAARRTKLITVGYSQTVPETVQNEVEVASINNPNDITRLGILVSGTVESWAAADGEIVMCYDSLNVLLKYKDVQSVFRFLHVFLGTLQETDAIAHFHVDPLAGDPQNINTLKPLFDNVITIDSIGVELE